MDTASEYYQDKVAVVTGGASGIGLALAETMLSYGARKVVLADFVSVQPPCGAEGLCSEGKWSASL